MAHDKNMPSLHPQTGPEACVAAKGTPELQRRSVSGSTVTAAQGSSTRTIEESGIIRLSVEDQTTFAKALLNPPAPSKALIRGAKLHAKDVEVR